MTKSTFEVMVCTHLQHSTTLTVVPMIINGAVTLRDAFSTQLTTGKTKQKKQSENTHRYTTEPNIDGRRTEQG